MEKGNAIWKWLSGQRLDKVVTFAIIPALLVASLLLPPFRVVTRISDIGWTAIKYDGGSLQDPDGTVVTLPAGVAGKTLKVRFSSVAREKFLAGEAGKELADAAAAIPQSILPRSPLYRLEFKQGASVPVNLAVPIPNDSEPVQSLDLYEWTGAAWRWIPSTVHPEADIITAELAGAPGPFIVALAQPAAKTSQSPVSSSSAAMGVQGAAAAKAVAPAADGSLEPAASLASNSLSACVWPSMPVLTNVGENGAPDLASLDAVLGDEGLMARHVNAIVKWVADGGHKGITLDYEGFDAGLSSRYSDFVGDLAAALHQAGAQLAVRVPAPVQAGDGWDSAPYDWAALGQSADAIRFAAPAEPSECVAGGSLDSLLAWAVSQVPRQKLAVEFSAMSLDVSALGARQVAMSQALLPLSQMAVDGGSVEILPGQELKLSAGLSPEADLSLDAATGAYKYEYTDAQNAKHTVWIDDGASLSRKLQTLEPYRLGGVFLTGITGDPVEQRMMAVLDQYSANQVASIQPSEFTLVWSVQSGNGPAVEATRSLEDGAYTFSAANPGEYVVAAGISMDGGRTVSGRGDRVSLLVVTPTPTPTPTPPPTPTPTRTPTPKPTAAPVAAAPAPSGGTGFAFGIQAHFLEQDKQRIVDSIRGLNGFTWVKQQARWEELEPNPGQYNLDQLDQTVSILSANGFKVLLSVVTAPRWARPGNTNFGVAGPPENPQTLANFVAFLAQRYKGKVQAYEIWNEQNIDGEWGYEPFSVDRYMAMLKASYQSIKAVDRGILVISGALTPAGTVSFGGHDYAVDDLWYIEEMYKRGLKNYCDGVGIHPSGFAHPPSVTVDDMFAGRYVPKAGDTRTTHRSFYFKSTMLTYRNVMVVYGDSTKRLWPTEFGWASLDGLGVGPQPDREYYALNNQQEQASYIVEAFRWARDRGWVGPMFLWNLNFATCNDAANEKSGFGILMPDWSPRIAYAALANMAK